VCVCLEITFELNIHIYSANVTAERTELMTFNLDIGLPVRSKVKVKGFRQSQKGNKFSNCCDSRNLTAWKFTSYIHKTESVSVSLFLMHGHGFVRIWTKFGLWHRYTFKMVTGVSERRSRPRTRAPRAVHTPLQMSGELRLGNSELAGRAPYSLGARCNGSSAVSARI